MRVSRVIDSRGHGKTLGKTKNRAFVCRHLGKINRVMHRILTCFVFLVGAATIPQAASADPARLGQEIGTAAPAFASGGTVATVQKVQYISNYNSRPYAYTRYYAYGKPRARGHRVARYRRRY